MRGSPRFWLQGLLIGALLATQTGVVVAQIPNPLDTGGGQLPSPVPTVDEAVQDAIDTVTDTVTDTINTSEETVNTVEDTTGQATDPVQAPKDTVGTVTDAAADSTSDTTNTVDGVTGTISQQKEAGGGATGTSLSGNSTGTGGTGDRAYTAAIAGTLQNLVRARGLFNSAALLAGAQPSLAILVDAVNDADGDGIFSDAESASEPRADVTFKALITNIGSTDFEIAGVSHSYAAASGPAQGKVCAELTGIMLAPGESLACSFPVPDYAPARGESLVNTVMAAGFEVGKSARRGASDSDTTTVETIVTSDEVLAVAIKRNLAFTGTEAARLLALALVLLGAGGGFMSLARVRSRRPTGRLPSEVSVESLESWTALHAPRVNEKAHTK